MKKSLGLGRGVNQLDYIDAVKGIAIAMVMIIHTAWGVGYFIPRVIAVSQMGVQLFFVASSVTLCLSARIRGCSGRDQVVDFYIRRLFRIAPLYWFGIIIYSLVRIFLSHTVLAKFFTYGSYTIGDVVANMTFVQGMVPSAMNSVVPGGWSIGTEVLFYIIFPIMWNLLGDNRRLTRIAIATSLLISMTQAIVVHFNVVNVTMDSFVYYNIINQAPVFLVGVLVYHRIVSDETASCLEMASAVASWLAMTAIWRFFPYALPIVPLMAAFSFNTLVIIMRRLGYSGFVGRSIVLLGRYSYGMYIMHFVFAWYVAGFIFGSNEVGFGVYMRTAIFYPVVLVFSYLSSVAVNAVVEKPGISLGKALIVNRHTKRDIDAR